MKKFKMNTFMIMILAIGLTIVGCTSNNLDISNLDNGNDDIITDPINEMPEEDEEVPVPEQMEESREETRLDEFYKRIELGDDLNEVMVLIGDRELDALEVEAELGRILIVKDILSAEDGLAYEIQITFEDDDYDDNLLDINEDDDYEITLIEYYFEEGLVARESREGYTVQVTEVEAGLEDMIKFDSKEGLYNYIITGEE